jgi:hypothetical protein
MADAEGRWFQFTLVDGMGVAVKLTEREGEWVTSELYVDAQHLTPARLRSIPLARLEAAANKNPEAYRYAVDAASGQDEPTFAELRASFDATRKTARLGDVHVVKSGRQQLKRPTGDDPDGFYRQVGKAYREYAAVTKKAVASIANEAEVPVGTAQRWVKEARRRGFLPPGERGKTG